jgi:mannose-6-phosphate isomerase-like protein (cupin superfamily)
METFELADLLQKHRAAGKQYLEFLRVSTLNAGIYVLEAGAADPQQPHEQDEVYYVITGRATFNCDGHDARFVSAGSVIYVEKGLEHRFVNIEEPLTILVLFAG